MERVSDILKRELEALKADIIQKSRDVGAYATGDTEKGYEVAVESEYHGWLGGFAYVGALETGRRAGKIPIYFSEIIKRWARAKNLPLANAEPKVFDKWARAVAWKIARYGNIRNPKREIFDEPIEEFSERLAAKLAGFYEHETIKSIFD